MSQNYPDDVSNSDFDVAEPDDVLVSGAVDVAVDVEIPAYMEDYEVRKELADAVRDRLEFDDEVIEIADVRIGEVYEE